MQQHCLQSCHQFPEQRTAQHRISVTEQVMLQSWSVTLAAILRTKEKFSPNESVSLEPLLFAPAQKRRLMRHRFCGSSNSSTAHLEICQLIANGFARTRNGIRHWF